MDKVSLILPVYNVEKYLKNCLDSIEKQTYQNMEVIIVNDGSTDNSKKICEEYAKKYENIKFFNKKNGGLSDARNYGIEKSTGKYITFVDSDDEITEDYVEYLLSLIKKYNTKMSIGSYSVITSKGTINYGDGYDEKLLSQKECLKRLLTDKGYTVSSWSKMYEKNLFDNIKYPTGKIYEDNGTTYKLILKCDKISYGPKEIYKYFKRKDSITHEKYSDKKKTIIEFSDEMAKDILKRYPELKDETLRKQVESRFCVLRQMQGKLTKEQTKEQENIIKFLKKNKDKILSSDIFDKRQKIAIKTLNLGKNFFYFSWNIYSKLKY